MVQNDVHWAGHAWRKESSTGSWKEPAPPPSQACRQAPSGLTVGILYRYEQNLKYQLTHTRFNPALPWGVGRSPGCFATSAIACVGRGIGVCLPWVFLSSRMWSFGPEECARKWGGWDEMEPEKLSKFSNRGKSSTNVTRWMQVTAKARGRGEPGT